MSTRQLASIAALLSIVVCVFGCVVFAFVLRTRPAEIAVTDTALQHTAIPTPLQTITPDVPTSIASPASASNPNIQFQLRQYSTYESHFGSRILIGDAINTSNITVCCIETVVSLLDAQGNVIETSSYNGADLCEVKPQQRYPFQTPIGKPALQYANIKIQFHARPAPALLFPCYQKLHVDGLTAHPPKYTWDAIGFTGKVTNVGDEPASLVHVFILAYDADDNVFDVADGYAKLSEIPPGGDSPFEANFQRLREPAARYEIFAQGR
jgi:hypothetical protein